MFSSWSLKTKLISFAFFSGFCLLLVGFVGIFALRKVAFNYDHVVDVNLANAHALSKILIAARDMAHTIAGLTDSETSKSVAEAAEKEFKKHLATFDQGVVEYLAVDFVEGEAEIWKEVEKAWKPIKEMNEKIVYLSGTEKAVDRALRDKLAHDELSNLRSIFRTNMGKLEDFQANEAKNWSNTARSTKDAISLILLATVIVGFVIAMLIGVYMATSISRTMNQVAAQLSGGADEVTSAATEISSTSEQLSASAVEQASSLQETASSVEEMSSMVKQNADNAGRSSETAKNGQNTANKGKQVVNEMISAMAEIDAANREISEVVKVISQIGNKTKVIDDIVFKTQLLSFNASVEAARAGEHGKGFAVVAEEVGNLAQMSGNAAREISEMLEVSLERVERMISSSKQKVEIGMNVGKRCGEVLDDLVEGVSEVNNMSNEIASACQEQARGITEINRAMTQMDQVTQQNASASQQSASAAEQLSQQAEILRASVGELLHLLNGSKYQVVSSQSGLVRPSASRPAAPRAAVKFQAKSKKPSSETQTLQGVPSSKNPGFDEAA